MMVELIVITGPTAVGKTELSILLAEEVQGEIISADSRQVYKYMDIGTAKPSYEYQQRVPHHMIDILNPAEDIDVVMYSKMARESIDSAKKRGSQPILVGGTGLYIRGVVDGIFEGPGRDVWIRQKLKGIYDEDHNRLHTLLESVDPESAKKIHPNDQQRLIRALETYYLTGKKMSKYQKEHGFKESCYDTIFIGLYREKDELNGIIDDRVDKMVASGFVEEVENLLEMGYSRSLNSMQGLGYGYISSSLEKEMNLDEAIELTKRDTRRYAKRQMTWLKKDDRMKWIKINGLCDYNDLLVKVRNHIYKKEEANA